MSFNSLFYLTFLLLIQLYVTSSTLIQDSTNDTSTTTSKSIIENAILTQRKNKFTRVVLNTNAMKQLITGDSILIECPLPKSTQTILSHENKNSKYKSAPVYITTWFKNQFKMHQFIGEYLDRVTFDGRKLKISDLVKSDTGVYSCEIIMGTGQIVHSANLSLQIDELDFNNNEMSETNQIGVEYQSENVDQVLTDYDGLGYTEQNKNLLNNYNKDFVNSENIAYSIFNLKSQSTNQLNFKSETSVQKENQLFSTPIVVIISVGIISIILIMFLYCFYKNI